MKTLKTLITTVASGAVLFMAPPALAATAEHSDTWIQTKLVMTYVFNRHLKAYDIDTDVREQVVYLKGTVETPIEKDLAGEIAKSIRDVKGVTNDLVVDQEKASLARKNPKATEERAFGQTVSDMTSTASIKSKLYLNKNINGGNINIATLDGVVTLTGSVPTDVERELVVKIAQNTDGVTKVNNDLSIAKHL